VASMSTAPVSVDRSMTGAYSLIISAAAREMGPAIKTAITAMATEPSSSGPAPKWPLSGAQVVSVMKWIPPFSRAFQPLAARKVTTAARMMRTTALLEASAKLKILSARVTARLMTIGVSSTDSVGGAGGGARRVIGLTSARPGARGSPGRSSPGRPRPTTQRHREPR
jgi:hypothetical protein